MKTKTLHVHYINKISTQYMLIHKLQNIGPKAPVAEDATL